MTYEPGELNCVACALSTNLTYLSRGQERRCRLHSGILDYHVEHGFAQPPNQGEYIGPRPVIPSTHMKYRKR